MILIVIASSVSLTVAQSVSDYSSKDSSAKSGIFDSKNLSVHHSVSYGMASMSNSPVQSQGLYSTLLTYKFSQPVTLNLNFGFPLMSTYSPAQNLNAQNIKSMDYFKSMPIDFSLSWQPRDNLFFNLSIMKNSGYGYGYPGSYGFFDRYDPFEPYFPRAASRPSAGAEKDQGTK